MRSRSTPGSAISASASVQFVVPIVITAGVFGWFGGDPAMVASGTRRRQALAAERRVHLGAVHRVSAFAAWFGMNDIADMRGVVRRSGGDLPAQAQLDMCWLYTGTFGSFIGYSAGFPLLAKIQFPTRGRAQVRLPRPVWSVRCRVRPPAGLSDQIRRRPRHASGCSR